MMPVNKIKGKTLGMLITLGVVVAVLVFILIKALRQDANLELEVKFSLPEMVDAEALSALGYSNYAIAVDGLVVAGSDLEALAVRPTASTAKMILGLAIMKAKPFALGEMGEILTINDDDYNRYLWYANHGGSNTAVAVGEEISEYDALMSVFLPSSNNMADTLAVWAFGSQENYREYVTEMLNEWGINNTTIGEDASGFSESTTSTASDLARIGQKLLENPVLAQIVSTKIYEVPVAGEIKNTNKLLGEKGIIGIKTGFIGEVSGYCLVSGYNYDGHIVTLALLGEVSREQSFSSSLAVIEAAQDILKNVTLVKKGDVVGYYESWWAGKIPIVTQADLSGLGWKDINKAVDLEMDEDGGTLKIRLGEREYTVPVEVTEFRKKPSFGERLKHVFGWKNITEAEIKKPNDSEKNEVDEPSDLEPEEGPVSDLDLAGNLEPITDANSANCTIGFGYLMLINPNFTVENEFISTRRGELISLYDNYGIVEGNPYNGDNLLDAEAAEKLNEMNIAYTTEYPGHAFETRSCFRAVGTTCGRLCAATGASDHHTGLTCDLLDPDYGISLDTDTYDQHLEWQWLRENSYKYGFIDRFPEAWAGGLMSEPLNVDENGSTGLFETWHYRYVGVKAATEIATGKYNNGEYDSLEHYLKALGLVSNLKSGECQ